MDLTGAAPADQQPAIKAGWPGENPKTACNPVDCDLPYGPQLPRPLVDLISGKNWAFELVDLPPDVGLEVCSEIADIARDRRHRRNRKSL